MQLKALFSSPKEVIVRRSYIEQLINHGGPGYLVFIVVINTYVLRLASYTYMEEPILIIAKVTNRIIMKPLFKCYITPIAVDGSRDVQYINPK
jgi:hypothetical protein